MLGRMGVRGFAGRTNFRIARGHRLVHFLGHGSGAGPNPQMARGIGTGEARSVPEGLGRCDLCLVGGGEG